MKTINKYINEKLKITKSKRTEYTFHPKTKNQLIRMITKEIKEKGVECSLNHININKMTNLRSLFAENKTLKKFNGDISEWDVSNVDDMSYMFAECDITFKNTDISGWDVSKVTNMAWMFEDIQFDPNSEYNYDLSNWDISKLDCINGMFYHSNFNSDSICEWDVSHITRMYKTFAGSKFNQDLSNWDLSNIKDSQLMFADSDIANNKNYWPKAVRPKF